MKLKLSVPQWHYSMLLDRERVAIFKEAIKKTVKPNDVVYDLGTGSGILAMIASQITKNVYAVELDPITYAYAKENIKINKCENINLIEADASEYNFKEPADVIIAEMLDTALITEPQVPVLNAIIKKGLLKEGGKLIPERAHNTAQVVIAKMGHIYYDEEVISKPVSEEICYSTVDFYNINKEEVSYNLKFRLKDNNINNNNTNLKNIILGIRLNTYTELNEKIIAGSTPMLNPPLIIPIKNPIIDNGILNVKLSYKMGGDLESIKVKCL
ncbi:50S ribosomal protein L11 methyltransferase [Methanothermococcus okinawensis]|uniref:Ribosomal L11 methyltransferase n=1 Tax=Methanothermococcus okinawensis (strain DSM 14208 / JCM 11175 / IH1) TaxID=647113 RepID=F8ANW8_METOI|nr:50S ribosomal protein L11 methyltransferase [Methanothermococcus okinawensis]AEH07109.1 ribosomal L11 methyltransferase [Methanothermococcus okinawensis IH1]